MKVKEILDKEFPNQRLEVIDSLCSCSGYGMLVDDIKDEMEKGKTMDECIQYALENRNKNHHQFYTTDLKYFKRTGRVSGPAASIGIALKVCPIMRLNAKGKIIAYSVAFGKKAALKKTIDTMEKNADNGKDYSGKCYISHSDNLPDAIKTKEALKARFPNLKDKIQIYEIGCIIACHCGPGTIAVYFHGNERKE